MPKIDPRGVIGGAIATAVLIAAPFAQTFEGYVGTAYKDPAGIPSYCYGETQNVDPLRVYSESECGDLLRKRMAADYAPALAECVPNLVNSERKYAFAASIDFAYNGGPIGFCGGTVKANGKRIVVPMSPMAKLFNDGKWAEGCRAFRGYYTTARNRRTGVRKQLPGLVRRREAEAALCAKS